MTRNATSAQAQSRETVSLTVEPLPCWLDPGRLLGAEPGAVYSAPDGSRRVMVTLGRSDAAWAVARLRGVGLDGRALRTEVDPSLSRALVRQGRLQDARARRQTTPGFVRAGARATGEGRYSLTPEALAVDLAARAAGRSIVDACCGSGGNAIAFARAGCRVTAIDRDPERIAEARHNAALYGVSRAMTFLVGDAADEVPRRSADLLFVDPPWGRDYSRVRTSRDDFPLLVQLLREPLPEYREIWAKLPPSFDTSTLPRGRPTAWFGRAKGDWHRVKFITLAWQGSP
jgi:SAM-dependent methyltransferase